MSNLPAIKEIYEQSVVAKKDEIRVLTALLNEPPMADWVVEHPYIKQEITVNGQKQKVPYKYIPIGTVEYLLRSIFGQYKIEVTGQGTAFNGVWVTVRVHYLDPITQTWLYHDGIGASQLQTKSGSSPAELQNINNGAITMAFPNAKSIAIKDACDHFGRLFGADLNRKDYVEYETLDSVSASIPFNENNPKWAKAVEAIAKGQVTIENAKKKYKNINSESEPKLILAVEKYKKEHGIV